MRAKTARPRTAGANSALTLRASQLLKHIDLLADRLTPARRPQDVAKPECTRTELRVLSALARNEPRTMTDLAASLGLPLSTATHAVDKLVEKGLVERTRPATDRRIVHVGFSPRGRAIDGFVKKSRSALARQLLQRLRSADRDSFLRRLARLAEQ